MKNAATLLILAGTLASAAALAQMPGDSGMGGGAGSPKQGMEMSTQQSQQMMGGHMMSQEMTRDMVDMMRQMDTMMKNMSGMMEAQKDPRRAHEMSKLMDDMAGTMHEMAQQMEMGKMDPATTKRMQERIQKMNQTLESMQKSGAKK